MTRSYLLAILLLLPSVGTSQVIWFFDDFRDGLSSEHWRVTDEKWKKSGSVLRIETKSYDDLLATTYYTYASGRFSVEVTMRGIRAGVYFCLDSPIHKALSHMVRFDEKSVLAGYFDGTGEFRATSVYDIPKLPTDWTKLRIDVDPIGKYYTLSLNGSFLGADTNLIFSSGYVGLEASDGVSEFKSVMISAPSAPRPPGLPQLGSQLEFQHLSFIQAKGTDLEIYLPELKRLVQIDTSGRWHSVKRLAAPPRPVTTMKLEGKLFGITEKQVFIRNSEGAVIDSLREHLVSPASLAILQKTLLVADPGARAIFQYSAKGKLLQRIDASLAGGFKAPRGMAVLGGKQIAVADYDRIVFVENGTASPPVITMGVGGSDCRISWQTPSSSTPWFEYGADGLGLTRISSVTSAGQSQKSVHLRDLAPLSRYSFRYGPALKTIPSNASGSKVLRFSTPPFDRSAMSYTRIPIMCMVYKTISYRDRYPSDRFPHIPDGRSLSGDDLTYLRTATDFNREFYFRNSGCRLVLDFDFFVVEDTLWLHDVGENDPYWLSPNDRVAKDFERAARSFGKQPEEYSGLVCPYAWVNYPPRRTIAVRGAAPGDTITIRQAVGGGTYGVPAPWKYGKYAGYTSNPFQDRFSRQDWLMTHEFHHQIDALMELSGYAEYYHADQPWKMPGRFGEDFDFNAQIMRLATHESWLNLRFGKLAQTRDSDHDGLPDDDPTLPFDEKRLGGSASTSDTDGDGLPDLAEVMAGSSRGSDLNNADSDGDVIPDGKDPEPLYPIDPSISRMSAVGALEGRPFGKIKTVSISADLFLAWSDSALLVSVVTDTPANFLLQVDANNDGWFHGFDNIQIRVLNNRDSATVADYYLRDCSSWTDSPKDRRDILRKTDLGLEREADSQGPSTQRFKVVVRIPRNDQYGFRLFPGKKLGLRFGVQTTNDLWVWEELFERNYMIQAHLQ